MSTTKNTVIIIRESVRESVTKDIVMGMVLLLVVGVGIVLQSQALQWIAGILFILGIISSATSTIRYTIPEARKKLDEIENETTGPKVLND